MAFFRRADVEKAAKDAGMTVREDEHSLVVEDTLTAWYFTKERGQREHDRAVEAIRETEELRRKREY